MARIIALLIGLGLLVFIVYQTDLSEVWRGVLNLGAPGAAAVVGIYLAVFLIDTASWQLTLPSVRLTPGWLYRLWKVRMVGEALNIVVPAGSVGGEPVKAVLLKKSHGIGYHEGAASVIMAKTNNLLALVVFIAVGLTIMARREWMPEPLLLGLMAGGAVLSLGVLGFFAVQRWRAASRLGAWLARRRIGRPLERALAHLEEVDHHFVRFYGQQPRRFAGAFVLGLCNWTLGAVELYVIMWFLDRPVTFADAVLIETAAQLARAGAFFIPGGLGAIEGIMVLVYDAMTGSAALGLAVALIRRGRELLWIAWGFWLGWLNGAGTAAPAATRASAPGERAHGD